MNKKFVNLDNARVDEQRKVMERIVKNGECPFCSENLCKYHPKPIILETGHWIVTENAWPYEMTKNHFLLISQRHIESSEELSRDEWADLKGILEILKERFNLTHGTLLMRFGDSSKTGGTVKHLHIQVVQSDPTHPNYDSKKGLRTRIG